MCKHPLPERRARASRFVAWRDHSLELLKQHRIQPHPDRQGVPTTTHTEEIMASLDAALGRGVEGVVFKSLGTPHVPGGREGDWIKLKPDYVPDMSDELDVLIIAGYYGEGVKRGGAISHFLLGVLAPASEKHKHPNVGYPHIYPFAKVGAGYSQKALAELRARLEDGQHVWQKNQRPRHLCGWVPNKTDDEPDVWFEPAKSVILSVQAYEIVKGEAFLPSAYTLRFPRVRKIRYDKPWNECERFEDLALRFEEGRAKISASRRSATDVARADPRTSSTAASGGSTRTRTGKPPVPQCDRWGSSATCAWIPRRSTRQRSKQTSSAAQWSSCVASVRRTPLRSAPRRTCNCWSNDWAASSTQIPQSGRASSCPPTTSPRRRCAQTSRTPCAGTRRIRHSQALLAVRVRRGGHALTAGASLCPVR